MQKGFSGILVLVVVLIIVGVGAYYLGKQPNSFVSQQDEIADWKTYTNSQGKFSLKYPGNFTLLEDSSSGGIAFVAISPPHKQNEIRYQRVLIEVNDNSENDSLESYIAKQALGADKFPRTPLLVDSKKALRVVLPGEYEYDTVLVKEGAFIYVIRLDMNPGPKIDPAVFEQIINSFEFN